MKSVRLRHVDRFVDRFGRERHYFRKGKGPRTVLPGRPGSEDFMLAYQTALAGQASKRKGGKDHATGSFDRLARDYFDSPDYRRLALGTQKTYRRVIERLLAVEGIGKRLVREMTRVHVQKIIARRAATPGAANDVLKKLKILLHFAIDNGWRKDDPTVRIKRFAEGEFHTWTDAEIVRFEAHWPLGTRERAAFALFLFTGQRASDIAKMQSDDVTEDGIWVVQLKTKAKLLIPRHPKLAEAMQIVGARQGALLKTGWGLPFSAKGISNFMADKINAAGLPKRCVAHGLRKAAARRLAEAGCSANEIAAITGHVTLEEVARYTRAAEQRKLARAAMARLAGTPATEAKFPNLSATFGKNDEKDNEIKEEMAGWRPGLNITANPYVIEIPL